MTSSSFVHLHVHSEYSMLDSTARISDLFDTALAQGSPALAITDHGTLSGMWQARAHALRTGVKLIPGLEAYLAIGSRFKRDTIEVSGEVSDDGAEETSDRKTKTKARTKVYEHLTILARNRAGWRNLILLQNESSKHLAGPFNRGKLIDYDLLAEHGDGLMVLTGCIGGPVHGPLSRAVEAERALEPMLAEGVAVDSARSSAADYELAKEIAHHARQQREVDADTVQDADSGMDARWADFAAHILPGKDAEAAQVLALRAHAERARAHAITERLIAAVGAEHVFVEVMEHGNAPEQATLPELRALAVRYGLQLVVTNDTHHTHEEERVSHGAWLAVGSKSTIANPKFSFHGAGYHLRGRDEMESLIPEDWWVAACRNTQAIADLVEDDIVPEPQRRLPEFPKPDGFEHINDFMKSLILEGIERKLPNGLTDEYRDRLNTEVHTIVTMGFVSYFLIVWEMISWARSQGSLVGPGRGSAAGSLVAYLLDITDVDPIEYGLLFERFLEPGRLELPDIDIDFESAFKPRVIKHLMELWGEDCVAQIGSIGKPRIRKAWKLALSALGEGESVKDRTAKLLPQGITAAELIESRETGEVHRENATFSTREFWQATLKLPYLDNALELVTSFYDVALNGSVHASGVIISPEPLTDLIPLRWESMKSADLDRWVTEWDYRDLEGFGLVKFDCLAIRNLDMANGAMRSVRRLGHDLSLSSLPHPDHDSHDTRVQRAFDMLRAGRTAGVFQLESAAMTRLLEDVAPESLDELSAVVALFRPGPLSAGMHTKYADRKHGREPISYDYLTPDPTEQQWLGGVMDVTYGVFVYQEQVMALGRVVAGFDDVWRSKLRKAVSKKIKTVMDEVGAKFMDGATQEFRDPQTGEIFSPVFSVATAERIWEAMKGSAEYLFNKSHSVAYALIAYYTAYLKANFPGDYGAATLAVTGTDKPEKRVAAMNALLGEGLQILPPDVNVSSIHTCPVGDNSVRLGLDEIKGFGAAEDLILERDSAGPFTSLDSLLTRVHVGEERRTLATNQVEALIDSGALDEFGARMGLHIVAKASDLSELPIPPIEFSPVELGVRQSSRILMMLDDDVRRRIQDTLTGWVRPGGQPEFQQPTAIPVGQLTQMDTPDGTQVYVSGILSGYSEKAYKRGMMGRIELEDVHGSIAGVIWEEQRSKAKEAGDIPPVGFPVVLCGRLETRSFTVQRPSEDSVGVNADGEAIDDGTDDEVEITRRQISVQSMYPIAVDLSPTGFMPASPLPRIDLTEAGPPPPSPDSDASHELGSTDLDVHMGALPQLEITPMTASPAAVVTELSPALTRTTAVAELVALPLVVNAVPELVEDLVPEVQEARPSLTLVPAVVADVSPELESQKEAEVQTMPAKPVRHEERLAAALAAGFQLPVMG